MCTIDMAVDPSNNATVALIPGQLSMKQDLDMAIFFITNWNWNQRSEDLRMSITMKRKVISELMTTFFPTLLLTAITFATTFFKPIFFEAALSVNLTTMLVMTTIFISNMESLPPTSYIKMIDIWLILCQMVPFAEVVLLTAMEYNREDKKKAKKKKRGKKTKKLQKTSAVTVSPAGEKVAFNEKKAEHLRFRFSLPTLKTIGEDSIFHIIVWGLLEN